MIWHWVFAVTGGLLAGWSLFQVNKGPEYEREKRGHLIRGLLGAAAIIGFTYSGWMESLTTGLLTLGVCLLSAAIGYLIGPFRLVQPAESFEEFEENEESEDKVPVDDTPEAKDE